MKLNQVAAVAIVACGTVVASFGGASAAPSFGSIPNGQSNEALPALFNSSVRNGWYGATLYLLGGPQDITVDYLGSEAGFNNSFLMGAFNPSTGGNTNSFSINGFSSATLSNVASGPLDFSFTTPLGSVSNGDSNENTPGSVNFFVSFEDQNAAGGLIAYLFLDDAGAGDDDNHDDMVMRLSVQNGQLSVVPVPATAFLLLGGLAGLGFVGRRRKAVS